ncbi:hypothetical protein [Flavobacterium luteum]|uniref:SPOR domain-containing protein n=1 Tax=Flavobacterium luteum TaxID=2026654 RepID=A0A7J5AHX3_9FLAO|nr:hypothetical protein [Flavobacterium luteum]KAB1157103.1 hypothetical protein F6464_07095 [Flavobacterium luteum]
MKKIYFLLAIFSFLISYSQLTTPFKLRYKASLKGDMTVISNNITNRVEKGNSNIPYNTSNISSSKHNDEFVMGYIDIDNDSSTFSSSSVDLIFEKKDSKKIVYAGLYWSATYKYNNGELTKEGQFLPLDPTREDFNEIKIKLPNQENYIDIKGEVIFDGLGYRNFKENAPYAIYADITKEILNLSNPLGTYTVANIRATVGKIKGGVAGGWTMFVVYEDQSMKEKVITSFDGFAGITNKALDLVYSGFQTLPEGHVNAKIAIAALEGDSNLVGDQVLFKVSNKEKYIPFSNLLRNENNFFNSTISIENEHFLNREPHSKNTLGYDSSLITIPNPDNSVIANNTKKATIRLKTSGDRYFLFFTAFNVECLETVKIIKLEESKENPLAATPTSSATVVENASDNPKPEQTSEPVKEVTYNITPKPTIAKQEESALVVPSVTPTVVKEIFNYDIPGQTKGYYIIVNVFAKQRNSINFIKFLKNKGLNAASFFNPIKKFYYVYIVKSDDKKLVENLKASKFNDTYSQDMWVLSVNNSKQSSPLVYSNNKKTKTKRISPYKKEV